MARFWFCESCGDWFTQTEPYQKLDACMLYAGRTKQSIVIGQILYCGNCAQAGSKWIEALKTDYERIETISP